MYRFFGYVFKTIRKVTNLTEKKQKTFALAIFFFQECRQIRTIALQIKQEFDSSVFNDKPQICL